MMKVIITSEFKDKYTGDVYKAGMVAEFGEKRATEIVARGFARLDTTDEPEETIQDELEETIQDEPEVPEVPVEDTPEESPQDQLFPESAAEPEESDMEEIPEDAQAAPTVSKTTRKGKKN